MWLTFKEQYLQNKKIENYQIISLYGENQIEIQRITLLLKEYYSYNTLNIKDIISNNGILLDALLINDLFGNKESFLIENIDNDQIKIISKIFHDNISKSNNVFILTTGVEVVGALNILCKRLELKDKLFYIDKLIDQYSILVTPSQRKILKNLLHRENIEIIENEIRKLYLLTVGGNIVLTDEKLFDFFDLPSHNVINNLIEAILYKHQDAFEILNSIIDKYQSILIIRAIYNYFLKLQKLFIIIKVKNISFNEAARNQYGVLFGNNQPGLLKRLETLDLLQINNIIEKIIQCEINIKTSPDRSKNLLEKMLFNMIF